MVFKSKLTKTKNINGGVKTSTKRGDGISSKAKNTDGAAKASTKRGGGTSSEKVFSESARRHRKDISRERRKMILVRHQLEKIKSDYEVKENKIRHLEQNIFNREDTLDPLLEDQDKNQAKREEIYQSLQYDANNGGLQLRDAPASESKEDQEDCDKSQSSTCTPKCASATEKHSDSSTVVASNQAHSGKQTNLEGSFLLDASSTLSNEDGGANINEGDESVLISGNSASREDSIMQNSIISDLLKFGNGADACNMSFNLMEAAVLTIGESVHNVMEAAYYGDKSIDESLLQNEEIEGNSSNIFVDSFEDLHESSSTGTPRANNRENEDTERREPISPSSRRVDKDDVLPFDPLNSVTCGIVRDAEGEKRVGCAPLILLGTDSVDQAFKSINCNTAAFGKRSELEDERVDCKSEEAGSSKKVTPTCDSLHSPMRDCPDDLPSNISEKKDNDATVVVDGIEIELDEAALEKELKNNVPDKKKSRSFFSLRKNKIKRGD
mmetsp:Transcript_1923/g.2279  ORF Transcript_1923/g.2279 Transcript_1923/m.2279 type:complete len:497 (+) Transcript_1923:91-1581(+)